MAENGNSGCHGNFQESSSSVLKSSFIVVGKEWTDIDEIDGFVEDKFEHEVDHNDGIHIIQGSDDKNNSERTISESVNKVDTIDVSVEKHGEFQDYLESDLTEKEHIKSKRVVGEDVIDIFDDSNSSSNSFTILGFQSLNTTEDSTECLDIENEVAEETKDVEIESQDFPEVERVDDIDADTEIADERKVVKIENQGFPEIKNDSEGFEYIGIESETAEEKNDVHVVKGRYGVDSDFSEDQGFLEIEHNSDGGDNIGIENEIADEKNDVQVENDSERVETIVGDRKCLHTAERSDSETEFEIVDKCLDTDKVSTSVHRSDIPFKNTAVDECFKETDKGLSNDIKGNVTESYDMKNMNKRELKGEEKTSVKKSRKQNIPKRVKKVDMEDNNVVGEDNSRFTDIDVDLGVKISEQNKIPDDISFTEDYSIEISDHAVTKNVQLNDESHDISRNKGSGVTVTKSEKSRKQCKPKRIDQLQLVNDLATNADDEKADTEVLGNESDVDIDTDEQYNDATEDSDFEMQTDNDTVNAIENVEENNRVSKFISCENLDENHERLVKGLEDIASDENGCEITGNVKESKDISPVVGNVEHFTSMSSNPFYYGFSQNLNLISSLSPGMLQGCSSSPGRFALDENGPENLEVIRQLREIRCNRYRKISIAEKREISAYANTHGVSQAAAYYNVSKSAVSMWTKLDFSNADDESTVKRKNCMSGNEKFEALCRKVKSERENKFKGMSKEDKFEVSRYAKLVGVREMSRCLGVALGTVSGWMRQFPYKVETDSPDETNPKKSNEIKDSIDVNETTDVCVMNVNSDNKRKKSEHGTKGNKKQKRSVELDRSSEACKRNEVADTKKKKSVENTNNIDKNESTEDRDNIKNEPEYVGETDYIGHETRTEQKDELDKMIAETWQRPDIDKCFEDVKELIKDSPLENDDFFRSLFDRVIACRADKYKTLKPSEKLEVVRYAKRIGVRRVAKILGLATGTLSGWNTKYQSSLGITDPSLEMSNKTELLVSYLSPDRNAESETTPVSQAALIDNIGEKSEVTAVKLLFKERFPILLQKIEVAKQIKFRNITTEEKIEFVKCSKLVGIRPTARVFGIPIGTLSGWITKYSKLLHPAYHVDVDNETGTSSAEYSSQFSHIGMNFPNTVGRNANIPGALGSSPTWPQGLVQSGQELDLTLFSQLQGIPTSQSSPSFPVLQSASSSSLATETGSHVISDDIISGDKSLKTSLNFYKGNQSDALLDKKSENQNSLDTAIKSEQTENQSAFDDGFEKEAKVMAEQYLKTAYKSIGIPI